MIEEFYDILPYQLQNLACSIYGFREKNIRTGRKFDEYYSDLIKSEFYDQSLIDNIVREKLNIVINRAYNHSNVFHKIFTDLKLSPCDIDSSDSLNLIPLLEKESVRNNYNNLRNIINTKSSIRKSKTSGSSGSCLSFFTTHEAIAFQWAVWWRHRRRFGFFPGQWHICFIGRPVLSSSTTNPPFWRIDYSRKQIIVSSCMLTKNRISKIVDFLNHSKVSFFVGYPSLVAQFCNLVEINNLSLDYKPVLISLGAEKCYQFQKDIISRVTRAKITDQYGFAEGCGNASRCEFGNYHEDWEYGLLECVKGVRNEDGSITGEIACTGFSNPLFPFIRYLNGDLGTWAPESYKCPCGRSSRVLFNIEGRNEDIVQTSTGNSIMRLDYLFKDTKTIKEAQVVQSEIDNILIKYVPYSNFDKDELNKIRLIVKKWISPLLHVDFEEVPSIERLPNGKFKAVLSKL